MLLAFVIQSRVGNIFSDDDELTPTHYENIDNSIDFKNDTFLDVNDWMHLNFHPKSSTTSFLPQKALLKRFQYKKE
jgi:hypothetical protein